MATSATWSDRVRWLARKAGGILFLAVLIGAWQAWTVIGDVDRIVAPGPAAVFGDIAGDPTVYLSASLETLRTAGLGLIIGTTLGSAVAVVTWWSPALGGLVSPWILVGRLVPVVALIPILARMFGYDARAVVAVTALLSLSFSYVLVGAGLRSAATTLTDLIAVFGGRRRDVLARVALPSALPGLASAVRMGATTSVFGALAAEFLIGVNGLGALFVRTRIDYSLIDRSWGVAVVASFVSAAVFLSTSRLERFTHRRFT